MENEQEQPQIDAEAASKEAVHKANNAAHALELARQAQLADVVERTAVKTKETVLQALKEVFGDDNTKDPAQMKVLVQRVPILCVNIEQTHKDIAEIKESLKDLKDVVDRKYVTIEMFTPTKLIAYGLMASMSSIFLAGITAIIISKITS